jgi:hypothetical protein
MADQEWEGRTRMKEAPAKTGSHGITESKEMSVDQRK